MSARDAAALAVLTVCALIALATVRFAVRCARGIAWLILTEPTWRAGARPTPYYVHRGELLFVLDDHTGLAWGPYADDRQALRKWHELDHIRAARQGGRL